MNTEQTSETRPNHPLHLAIANAIRASVPSEAEIIRDPACGGTQHLPLFIGTNKARETRMCCVDLLVLSEGQIRVIVEIEESGFLPTKVCGKFFQAVLADHFIHESHGNSMVSYADRVLFLHVLDGSKCLPTGTRKDAQAELMAEKIRELLPMRRITDYSLLFVRGTDDREGLASVSEVVSRTLAGAVIAAG